MTSDSQPIELIEGGIRVLDFTGEYRRDKIIERHAGGFDGLIGYVGTETVGAATMRSVLERTNISNCDRATLERLLGPERVQQVRAFHDESDEEGAGSDEQLLRVLRDLRDVLNKRLPG